MPKLKKSPHQWTATFREFAASKEPTLGRGKAPRKNTAEYEAYQKIMNCPVKKVGGSGQMQAKILFYSRGASPSESCLHMQFPPQVPSVASENTRAEPHSQPIRETRKTKDKPISRPRPASSNAYSQGDH